MKPPKNKKADKIKSSPANQNKPERENEREEQQDKVPVDNDARQYFNEQSEDQELKNDDKKMPL